MTQDESIIAIDIRTIEIPNVSGNHLTSCYGAGKWR